MVLRPPPVVICKQCNRNQFVGWTLVWVGKVGKMAKSVPMLTTKLPVLPALLACCWAAEMSFLERPHRSPHPQHALWGCGKREDDAWAGAAPANSMSSGGHQTRPFRVQLCQSRNARESQTQAGQTGRQRTGRVQTTFSVSPLGCEGCVSGLQTVR